MAERERKKSIMVYLNDKEMELLEMRCREVKESKSQVIRELIVFGFTYYVDYEKLKDVSKELNAIGKNINQIAATHVDKQSVHNHIIFCSADNFTGRKFVCRKKTYWDIRRISDKLCEENGLSVIENPQKHTGLSYEDWIAKGHEEPLRDKLKKDIRECIRLSSTYDDFIRLMRDRDYEVKGEILDDGSGKKTAKYIRFKAIGYDQFVRGCYRSLGKGFSKEEIAEAIEKQAAIKAMTAPIPVKKMEDLIKKTAPYNNLIDRSSEDFKDSPWLNRWADKKDLQSVAHAYAQAGDTVQLQEKIDAARKEAADIQASIVEINKKLRTLKELAVSIRSYQDSRKYVDAYKKARNKEKFYENHESQMIIFEAAEREIRAKGLDPAKVTYEQVIEGIEKLNAQKKSAQAEYK
ncbi:MAG: relaxase/mobilization nuclease domain-containing protein [Lachnospiraceae bacterium]|nr:relaxase/mobilization nuclease domain-containing protein [Lachnospiraceae bacterium]